MVLEHSSSLGDLQNLKRKNTTLVPSKKKKKGRTLLFQQVSCFLKLVKLKILLLSKRYCSAVSIITPHRLTMGNLQTWGWKVKAMVQVLWSWGEAKHNILTLYFQFQCGRVLLSEGCSSFINEPLKINNSKKGSLKVVVVILSTPNPPC
jgi:hypothetical protein